MRDRSHSFVVAGVAVMMSILGGGCAKEEGAVDANVPPAKIDAGVPKNLPADAPPVVGEQIKSSQDAGQAMRSQAAKNGADYTAARAKNP